jgi:hypothetical protein
MNPRHPTQHPNLFAARGSRDRRPKGGALVPRFVATLAGRGWVAAYHIATELSTDLRSLRAAVHESEGRILGNQRGYILTTEATLQEVHAVTRRLLSQSNRMRERVRQIERVRHTACGDLGSAA